MSAPKYKKPKWNLALCKTCKNYMDEKYVSHCRKQGHTIVPVPNEPFTIPNLTFIEYYRTYSGTSRVLLKSFDTGYKYTMSMGDWEKITPLLERGVLKDKYWFMWTKKSSRMSLKPLGKDE